jgi:hypothetical protein
MDHPPGRQLAGGRRHGRAGRRAARVVAPQLRHDRRAAGSVDRTVDPASTGERGVGRIDDRVGRVARDVADGEGEDARSDRAFDLVEGVSCSRRRRPS